MLGEFSLLEAVAILLAGAGAGAINAAVGSGTLITFPALVAFGVPPQAATMSNALGLIPGNIAGSFGYRAQMRGYGPQLAKWIPASFTGAIVGALLLVSLPARTFEAIVPVLIVLAVIMVIGQPFLKTYLSARKARAQGAAGGEVSGGAEASSGAELGGASAGPSGAMQVAVFSAIFVTAIYGGYFAAAQGVLLVGLLGLLTSYPLQRINAFKNVLVLVVNSVAAVTYMIIGWNKINWMAALLVAIGSLIGGYVGAQFAQKLPDWLLRGVIVLLSIVAFIRIIQL